MRKTSVVYLMTKFGWFLCLFICAFYIVNPTRCTNVSILCLKNTLHVSDGLSAHHQEIKTVRTATGICQTDTAVCCSVWHMPVAVCTVLISWWWTERPSETCRVFSKNKINWGIGASCWICYRNILRCTALRTSNFSAFVWSIADSILIFLLFNELG